MKHRKIGAVMTSDVIKARPRDSFKEVARLLMENRISGVPVVDDEERVVGVVSETDLMLHQTLQADEPPRHPLLARLTRVGRSRTAKAHAKRAHRLMTAPAVTVHPHDTVTDAARIMAERGIERLPVVDEEDRLIGIVTRRDLLKVFVRPDEEIRQDIVDEVLVRTLWLTPQALDVTVVQGMVTLAGDLERQSEAEIAERLAAKVDGVIGVRSELTYRLDDSDLRREHAALHGVADDWLRKL